MKNTAVVDSSVWLEILGCGEMETQCKEGLKKFNELCVPTTVMFEVYRKISKQLGEQDVALSVISYLSQYRVLDLDKSIALAAADLSIEYKLGMADSIVLAHAHHENAILLTLDYDFSKIPRTKNLRS